MDISSRSSIEEVRQAIQSRGGTLACNVCGREEFSLEHVSPRDAAGAGYGTHQLQRADFICENCGHVMGFELEKLRSNR